MRRSTIAQRGAPTRMRMRKLSKLSNPISRTSNWTFAFVLATVMTAAVTADPKARVAPALTADVVQAFPPLLASDTSELRRGSPERWRREGGRTGVAAGETNR